MDTIQLTRDVIIITWGAVTTVATAAAIVLGWALYRRVNRILKAAEEVTTTLQHGLGVLSRPIGILKFVQRLRGTTEAVMDFVSDEKKGGREQRT